MGTPATRAEIIEKLVEYLLYRTPGQRTDSHLQRHPVDPAGSSGLKISGIDCPMGAAADRYCPRSGQQNRIHGRVSGRMPGRWCRESRIDSSEYKATNISKSKCPACGKNMLLVNGKRGKMLVCPDRNCGHRQPEKEAEVDIFRKNKNTERVNQKLIAQYSDKGELGQSLGDKLKAALEKKESKRRKSAEGFNYNCPKEFISCFNSVKHF